MPLLPRYSARLGVVATAGLLVVIAVAWRALAFRVPDGPLPTQLQWVVDHSNEGRAFSGTIVLARSGRAVFTLNAGVADSATQRPLSTDVPYPIASISKPLTALLVMQLVDARRLSVADSLVKHLPALAGTAAGRITVEQLLTHQSGIEEVISRHPDRRITADDLRTARVQPASTAYSNTGYVCLALVIEAVTGLPYDSVLTQQLLRPAAMSHAGVLRARSGTAIEAQRVELVKGDGGTRAPLDIGASPEVLDGAGSIFASADDLVHLDRALANGTLLSVDMQALMTAPRGDNRGYGWSLAEQDGRSYSWHSGNLPGYSTYFARIPARDEVLIILSNRSDTDARALARRLLQASKRSPQSADR